MPTNFRANYGKKGRQTKNKQAEVQTFYSFRGWDIPIGCMLLNIIDLLLDHWIDGNYSYYILFHQFSPTSSKELRAATEW